MMTQPNILPRAMSLAVHELRTPVTVVAGYLRMLLKEQGGPLTEKQRKMLEEADKSCSRLGALVAEMSEFGKLESREQPLARQDFDIAALAAELASNMHEGDDRGVRVVTRGTDAPVIVNGDRARVAAALRALMLSAVRERGEPGTITVDCTPIDGPPPSVRVAIGDEVMLPALTQSTGVFDEWRGGMGLALPVARRVIDAHGGALWSAEGGHSKAACALRIPLRP